MTYGLRQGPRPSRRSMLGLLATVPVAAGGVLTASGAAQGEQSRSGSIPTDLLPGPEDLLPGSRYDRFVAEQAARDQFSGTLLLAHKGVPVLTRAYGMADKKKSIPNRPDTIFSLASVSKFFTAIAATQFVQRGTVVLHETLGTYLDGFPPEIADKVTIHQLFTHTSGITEYTSSPEWQEQHKHWDTPDEEFEGTMAIIRTLPPDAVPGTRYRYCNTEYFLLGAIVAKLSGLSFQEYVRRHVFAAADMRETDYYTRDQVLAGKNFAHAYGEPGPNGQRPDLTAQGKGEGGFGCGATGASSNLVDMARFVRAMYDGTLIGSTYTELITSAKYPIPPDERKPSQQRPGLMFAAYGMDHAILNNQRIITRTGGGPGHGISTFVSVYPDLDWVAVVLVNYYIDTVPYLQLQDKLVTR